MKKKDERERKATTTTITKNQNEMNKKEGRIFGDVLDAFYTSFILFTFLCVSLLLKSKNKISVELFCIE